MSLLDHVHVHCPYCDERLEVSVEPDALGQSYIEDCQICCQPMQMNIFTDPASGELSVSARRDDD